MALSFDAADPSKPQGLELERLSASAVLRRPAFNGVYSIGPNAFDEQMSQDVISGTFDDPPRYLDFFSMFNLITAVIAKSGVGGIFVLMLLENIIPIIPSELILPLAGFQAARGQFNPLIAVMAATAGSAIGGAAWYAFGRWFGLRRLEAMAEKNGRWSLFTRGEIVRADAWFKRWGPLAVCLGRTLPGVRGVICIPAGIAGLSLPRFLFWSSLGAFIWSALLVSCGFILNAHYDAIQHWLNPITDGFIVICVCLYLFRAVTWRPGRS